MVSSKISQKPIDLTKNALHAVVKLVNNHRSLVILLLIFFITLLLVSPSLMPEYNYINPQDEAKYVDSGWRLLRGDLRDFAWGPIVALVYAPVHLVIGNSPDWFMIENWVGRFILYSFLWWSIIYLALQFKEYVSPYIMAGVLFIATPFIFILNNQSDAVFLGFSSLALAQLIRYNRHRNLRYLGLSSVFVGLGILARVETIILIATLVILGLIISRGKPSFIKIILTAILPALLILSIYFLGSYLLMGKLDLGIANKSYDSFEVSQQVLTGGDYDLARQETRQLFGTPEENHNSVIRAIFRNPYAYALRIMANAKTIPDNYFAFFGKKLGPILLIFAFWGMYELIRKKAYLLLGLVLAWAAYSLVSLGFFTLHLIPQVSYLPLLLGAIGIAGIFDSESHPWVRLIFLLTILLLLIISWIADKPAFVVGFLLVAIVLIFSWLAQPNSKLSQPNIQIPIFLVLMVGLILREPFPFPNYPSLGTSNHELAIHYLEQTLTPQTIVLVPTPLPAIAAKMLYITMSDVPGSISNLNEFWSFLKQRDVQALYLDSNRRERKDIYDLFEGKFDQFFIQGYTSSDNTIRIFLVK